MKKTLLRILILVGIAGAIFGLVSIKEGNDQAWEKRKERDGCVKAERSKREQLAHPEEHKYVCDNGEVVWRHE